MTTGVLVMAYGTPTGPDQVAEYYTHIRRGRPPEPEQLAELVSRYEAIGGISPLAARTAAQVDAIAAALGHAGPDAARPGAAEEGDWTVRLGQKHAAPFIEDGVAELVEAGVERIVGVVLAPHDSAGSVGQYVSRAAEAAAAAGVPIRAVRSWGLLDELVEFQAAEVRRCLAELPGPTEVVFTAHSLPERVLVGDPYPDQLHASAAATARRAGLAQWDGWGLGWQSAGRTPEPWRGPDVLTIIDDLAATGDSEGILVVPQGFTSDHLEVLYDLDIEAAARASAAGLAFARTRVVNDDPTVMAALAAVVRAAALGEAPPTGSSWQEENGP